MRTIGRLGAFGLVVGAAGLTGTQVIDSTPTAADGELVVNGDFESGLRGWRSNDAVTQPLELATGRGGGSAAALRATKDGAVVLNDAKNTVGSTPASGVYEVSAYVRTSRDGLTGRLRLREVASGKLLKSAGTTFTGTTDWQKVTLTYEPTAARSVLDLNVVGWKVPAGEAVVVDDVSMRLATGTAPRPAPSAPAPTRTSGPAPSAPGKPVPSMPPPTSTTVEPPKPVPGAPGGCIAANGIPGCGGTYFGAAIGGNADPKGRESQFGAKLALRRTYYRADQVDSAVKAVKADLAADRLPWISFKLPHAWTDMANGKGDAWAEDLGNRLDAVDGPVWVAFHHEPEGDGDLKEWTRMQARLSGLVSSDNVAFSIILTGWHQFYSGDPAYSLDALWPGDKAVDILGVDIYNWYGTVKNGKTSTSMSNFSTEYYAKLKAFSAEHGGVKWAVAESGYTDSAAAVDAAWLQRSYTQMRQAGGIAFAYFDSPLNSEPSWTWQLNSPQKIGAFKAALAGTLRLG
jgi:hypothetical protein